MKVRFGIIGCGGIANLYHMRDLSQIEDAELVGCCDVDEERARAFAEKWGAKFWTTDRRKLLDRDDVDAVIISTWHATHAKFAVEALKADKHVLVQKPLATKLADADLLVEAAKRSKKLTFCFPWLWTPAYELAKQLIDDGAIGKVCQGRRRVAHGGPPRDSWFYNPDVAKVGASFDMGVYAVAGITGLLGPAASVAGLVKTMEQGVRIDDNALMQFEFASGAIGSAETSWTQAATREDTVVYGTEGTIVLGAYPHRDVVQMFTRNVTPVPPSLRGKGGRGISGWIELQVPTAPPAQAHRHFVECILKNERPRGTPEHARHVLEIMLGALKSEKTGRRIRLKTDFT